MDASEAKAIFLAAAEACHASKGEWRRGGAGYQAEDNLASV
jgi:hypothetical protein